MEMAIFVEKAPLCSCKVDKIAYICKDVNCKNHKTQNLYCTKCLESGSHPHFPLVSLMSVINELKIKWSLLKETTTKVNKSAVKQFNEIKPLIAYLDEELT